MNETTDILRPHLCVGLLAHVDAGKTTLSEAMLFKSGAIRKAGRVDSRDAFLDTFDLERERGITIFSKQAELVIGNQPVTLMDTPGHVDFSAEAERVLQVLDAAILVVSAADGVQGHTRTLFSLLERYDVPVLLFVNKMDQPGSEKGKVLQQLHASLSDSCVDFTSPHTSDWADASGMCSETLMEEYLETGDVSDASVWEAVQNRELFPVYFGSALKMEGIEALCQAVEQFGIYHRDSQENRILAAKEGINLDSFRSQAEAEFSARVYKISRDDQKNRLTWLKIESGTLRVKDTPTGQDKVNQIRVYSGSRFQTVQEASAGMAVAVTGLTDTRCGQGIGNTGASRLPSLAPVLHYDVLPPDGMDPNRLMSQLSEIEEENPELQTVWNEQTGRIEACLMGPVQLEILTRLLKDRFQTEVTFGQGSIVYKETIADTVEGVGHFEPLRHYAEVHVKLEPGEPGSGITLAADVSEDMLARNWQRLILTHLGEKMHRGVLTGSVLTDVKMTVVAGRAHNKHTEGGDFREATYRAVRQGLMQAKNILLEPVYSFELTLPTSSVGKAMTDLERLGASISAPETVGEEAILTGTGPVSTLQNYQTEVAAYTHGHGSFRCEPAGYAPCKNTEEVMREFAYDPELDLANQPGSVFCAHGSGIYVDWWEVPAYMHVDSGLGLLDVPTPEEELEEQTQRYREGIADEEELRQIFERTYGPVKRRLGDWDAPMRMDFSAPAEKPFVWKKKKDVKQVLLVDGYNVIFAWKELSELAAKNIHAAREKLQDILSNYQAFRGMEVIVVFDAYRVEGHPCEVLRYQNISVVYTAEAQTADAYIEETALEIGKKYQVTVATSDGLEQVIIRGRGCALLSSRELQKEIEGMEQEIRDEYLENRLAPASSGPKLFDHLDEETRKHLEDVRMGKTEFGDTQK